MRKPTLGTTQTGLYSNRSWLEALEFKKKKRNCTICVTKTKALISFAVTAQLICTFVFAYADICVFFYAAAQLLYLNSVFRSISY